MSVPDAEVRGAVPRFVGREPLLEQLDNALDAAAAGRGSLVVLAGEPGIGKTRLAEEGAGLARDHGFVVAWSACAEDRSAPGFWPWTQLVNAMVAADPSLSAALGAASRLTEVGVAADIHPDPELARYALFDSVSTVLRAATRTQPLLLVIDDLHWVDVPSLAMLSFVTKQLPVLPVFIVATCRAGEAPSSEGQRRLDELVALATRIDIGGLDVTDLAALVSDVTGKPIDQVAVDELQRRTGGNPLFATEIARIAQAERSRIAETPVPDTIRAVLVQRLRPLSAEAREVLDAGVVIGTRFRADVLGTVITQDGKHLTQDGKHLLELLDEAASRRFIRPTELGEYEFTHALVREAIYQDLGLARRVRLHERIADALAGLAAASVPVDPAELAYHLAAAAPAGRAGDAVRQLRVAGDASMRMLAYEEAVRHYAAALDLLSSHPSVADRAELLLALGAAQIAAGDPDGARESHLAAAELARTGGKAEQLATAALGLGGGSVGFEVALFDREQVMLLEEALAELDATSALRPFVLARLSVAMSLDALVERRAELSRQAVELARGNGDRSALAVALAAHCDAIAGPADSEDRRAAAEEIVALARELGDVRLELLGRRLALVALLEMGELGGADAQIAAFARLADSLRQSTFGWYVPLWRGMQALVAGRFAEASDQLKRAEGEGERAGSPNAEILCATQRWWILVESARHQEARNFLAELGDQPSWTSIGYQLTTALCELQAGQLDSARHRIAQVGVDGLRTLSADSEWLPYMTGTALVVSRVGVRGMADWLHPQLLPYRNRFVVDGIGAHCFGSVERFLGLLAAVRGRSDDARNHFDAAVAANESAGMPLAVAATLRDAATALADAQWYRRAIDAYRSLSIDAQVVDLSARLEALGERAGSPAAVESAAASSTAADPQLTGEFVCEGEYWRLRWAGETVHIKDSKGMHDLALLLGQPGRETTALDLTGAPGGGDLGEVIDAQARAAYQARLAELEGEIDDADRLGDAGRSDHAIAERDALVEQLTAAYGIGGRVRRTGDPGEKARSAVSWRIRHAIRRIADVHPDLGNHLKHAVRTGRYVVYDAEHPVTWTTR